ncbi:hypothetical protein B0H19DRAFT_1139315 [Mycena capillaripes]|nr:hypothetical protein B0H19DRAFT_1139315 [Mycena capillaripes]
MPALNARDSSGSSPNTGLIVALVVGALVLTVVLAALLILIFKRRRAARVTNLPPSTYKQFMSHAERNQTLYSGHRKNDSTGPLLEETPMANWIPGRHERMQSSDLPSLPPNNVVHNYSSDEDEDHELGPPMQTVGPITYIRPSPPDLRLSIPLPQSASNPPKGRYQAPTERPPSPASPASSSSEYSEYSASASTRMHAIDLASPPPPVPALPAYLRPRSELSPEEPPLVRGDTVKVAGLLKSRAKRAAKAKAPERSMTRTSHIERADSIKELPTPSSESPDEPEERSWRARSPPPPLPTRTMTVDANDSFADTLEYYTSQPFASPHSPQSVSSYDTIRPTKNTL